MGRKHELTTRIPGARTVAGAIDWIREHSVEYDELTVEVSDDGAVTANGGPGSYKSITARLRGQITDDGNGPVLTAAIRKPSGGLIWPWLMAIPAVCVGLGATGSLLFDGMSPGPLLIGLPGCAALGFLSWWLVKQREQEFRQDVNLITAALHEFLTGRYDD